MQADGGKGGVGRSARGSTRPPRSRSVQPEPSDPHRTFPLNRSLTLPNFLKISTQDRTHARAQRTQLNTQRTQPRRPSHTPASLTHVALRGAREPARRAPATGTGTGTGTDRYRHRFRYRHRYRSVGRYTSPLAMGHTATRVPIQRLPKYRYIKISTQDRTHARTIRTQLSPTNNGPTTHSTTPSLTHHRLAHSRRAQRRS